MFLTLKPQTSPGSLGFSKQWLSPPHHWLHPVWTRLDSGAGRGEWCWGPKWCKSCLQKKVQKGMGGKGNGMQICSFRRCARRLMLFTWNVHASTIPIKKYACSMACLRPFEVVLSLGLSCPRGRYNCFTFLLHVGNILPLCPMLTHECCAFVYFRSMNSAY